MEFARLPFTENISAHQENGWLIIEALKSVLHILDLKKKHINIEVPDIYQNTTCDLCGTYSGNPSDAQQLPNDTRISEPDVFGPSWKLPHTGYHSNPSQGTFFPLVMIWSNPTCTTRSGQP